MRRITGEFHASAPPDDMWVRHYFGPLQPRADSCTLSRPDFFTGLRPKHEARSTLTNSIPALNLFQVLLRHISSGLGGAKRCAVSMFPWAQLRSDAINLISGGHAVSRFFLNGSLRLGEYRAQRSAIEAPKLTLFPASSIVPSRTSSLLKGISFFERTRAL